VHLCVLVCQTSVLQGALEFSGQTFFFPCSIICAIHLFIHVFMESFQTITHFQTVEFERLVVNPVISVFCLCAADNLMLCWTCYHSDKAMKEMLPTARPWAASNYSICLLDPLKCDLLKCHAVAHEILLAVVE